MNILSLFDGISCARVALERANIKVDKYYSSEIDKYAIKIAQKNYPDTIQLGDVRILNTPMLLCKNIDLLIGGSPCQDLSIAKKNRQGLDGARSGLFWEYVRILKEVKPKYFVLENVNSMPNESKAIITKTLGVDPIMINASLVSAQNRKRLFWTNIPNVTLPEDRGILLKDILQPPAEVDDRMVTNGKAFSVTASYNGAVAWNSIERKQRTMVRIGQFGSGGQGDRIYSPEGKSVSLSALGGGRGAKTGLYSTDNIIRKLTPIECERLQGLQDNYTDGVSNTQRYKMLGNAFNCDVVAHILKQLIPSKTN